MLVKQHGQQTIGRNKADKAPGIIDDRQRTFPMFNCLPGGFLLILSRPHRRRIPTHDIANPDLGGALSRSSILRTPTSLPLSQTPMCVALSNCLPSSDCLNSPACVWEDTTGTRVQHALKQSQMPDG